MRRFWTTWQFLRAQQMAQPVHVQYIPWTWSLMHSKTRTLQHSQLTNCTHSFKRVSKFTERSLMLLGHLCLNLLIEYILLSFSQQEAFKQTSKKQRHFIAGCAVFSVLRTCPNWLQQENAFQLLCHSPTSKSKGPWMDYRASATISRRLSPLYSVDPGCSGNH